MPPRLTWASISGCLSQTDNSYSGNKQQQLKNQATLSDHPIISASLRTSRWDVLSRTRVYLVCCIVVRSYKGRSRIQLLSMSEEVTKNRDYCIFNKN